MVFTVAVFTWSPAPWYLHVQLDGVHAQDGVANMAEEISS